MRQNHELNALRARQKQAKAGSDRTFGYAFAALALAIGIYKQWLKQPSFAWLIAGGILLAMAWLRPAWLRPAKLLWFRLGQLLQHVTSPVILALVWYGVMTPVAFMMRLSGKRPLHLERDPHAASYWIKRNPADAINFKNQF